MPLEAWQTICNCPCRRHLELHRAYFRMMWTLAWSDSASCRGLPPDRRGDFVSHLFVDPAQDGVIDSEQVMKFNGADVNDRKPRSRFSS